MTQQTLLKTVLCKLITEARGIAFVIFNVALLSLLFALMAEFFWGVKPCVLCLYQRYIFWALAGSAIAGVVLNKKIISYLYILITCGGIALSTYHIGVEQHWWKGPDACSADAPTVNQNLSQAEQIQAFKNKLQKKPTTIARCDQVNWTIFGLSATIWTLLVYLAITAYLAICVRKNCMTSYRKSF